ncbi:MAG: hypothetical protein Q7R95_03955 [bacterium]|nr:hypothetical protein [bacterium]
MKKNKHPKVKNKPFFSQSSISALSLYGKTVTIILLTILLIINIVSSQNISPLYAQITNYNVKAATQFLKDIRFLPFFSNELKTHAQIYGKDIENQVFSEEIMQKQLIQKYEQLLASNPESRDLLYGLYELYYKVGDKDKAVMYLHRAKEIDPNITN